MLARIIGALMAAALLASCSALKLAYNNLPEVAYWWLDGYVDFDDAQTPRVREELRQLLAWHRRTELPKVAGLLRSAAALAPGEVAAAQVCAFSADIRARLLAVAERAEDPGADLALSLDGAQLQRLERKYAEVNEQYRKQWLALSTGEQQDKRYDQFLKRTEDFYGPLVEAQRELLRQQVARSAFDAQQIDAQRRTQQRETLALLHGLRTHQTPAAEVRLVLRAHVQRIADPPAGTWRAYQQTLLEENCANLASLHNRTTPAQRERAVRRLKAYEDDVRQLAIAP